MKLIQKSPVITKAIDRVRELIDKKTRGDTVTWAEIESLAGFERYSSHWSAFIHRLRRGVMRDRGIVLEAVPGVGLKLLTKKENLLDHPEGRARRARRQHFRGRAALEAIKDQELTDHERQVRNKQVDAMTYGSKASLRVARLAATLAKPK